MKILIIEDDEVMVSLYKQQLTQSLHGEKIKFLFASSIQEAKKEFEQNKNNIKIIVFDGCILGSTEKPNTTNLVTEFKDSFSGHMIAASGNPEFREKLVKAGCTSFYSKHKVHEKIIEILNEFYGK